jgi:hypothetical protein
VAGAAAEVHGYRSPYTTILRAREFILLEHSKRAI